MKEEVDERIDENNLWWFDRTETGNTSSVTKGINEGEGIRSRSLGQQRKCPTDSANDGQKKGFDLRLAKRMVQGVPRCRSCYLPHLCLFPWSEGFGVAKPM